MATGPVPHTLWPSRSLTAISIVFAERRIHTWYHLPISSHSSSRLRNCQPSVLRVWRLRCPWFWR